MAETTIEKLTNAKFFKTANPTKFERIKQLKKQKINLADWETSPYDFGFGVVNKTQEKSIRKKIIEAAEAEIELEEATEGIY